MCAQIILPRVGLLAHGARQGGVGRDASSPLCDFPVLPVGDAQHWAGLAALGGLVVHDGDGGGRFGMVVNDGRLLRQLLLRHGRRRRRDVVL